MWGGILGETPGRLLKVANLPAREPRVQLLPVVQLDGPLHGQVGQAAVQRAPQGRLHPRDRGETIPIRGGDICMRLYCAPEAHFSADFYPLFFYKHGTYLIPGWPMLIFLPIPG